MTYAIQACRMGGCGSLGHQSDFLHVISGANLLIDILYGPFWKDSVIRPLFGKLIDVHYLGLSNGWLW